LYVDLRTTTRILPKKGLDQVDLNSSDAAVSVYHDEPDSVLALRGGFHLDLARELHRTALELAGTGGSVVVDCSQAEHLDGCAVQVLLALKLALEHGGGSLRMRGESAEVRKYLGWAGLNAHFPICSPSDTAAETPVAPPPKRRRTPRKRLL
jgi:anti-anti-sigma factor